MNSIYFDNAATTRVLPGAAAEAMRMMTEGYGNPSSVHALGFAAEKELKNARETVAKAMGASLREYELTFTGSGSEADNLAILGTARLLTKKGNRILMGDSEHPAVANTRAELEKLGYEVLLIPNRGGRIDFDFVRENLTGKTVLITHMTVNNETGAEYDIRELCRVRDELCPHCLVHTDAVQAFLKTQYALCDTGADLISVSSHKIHAPKGVGALLWKKGIRLSPIVVGGGQEGGLRSGTEPLPSVCAFAYAAKELSGSGAENYEKVSALYTYTKERILSALPGTVIHEPEHHTPYILSAAFTGLKSEVLLRFLSEKGIYVSAGSACSSKHRENRVLKNFGIDDRIADSTLRISFCESNTESEVDELVTALAAGAVSLARMR